MQDGGMPDFVVEFGKDDEPPADGRLRGPAFERNHAPIWSVIAPFVQGRSGDVLEVPLQAAESVDKGGMTRRAIDAATEFVIGLFLSGNKRI